MQKYACATGNKYINFLHCKNDLSVIKMYCNNCNCIKKECGLFMMYLSYLTFIVDQICLSGQNPCSLLKWMTCKEVNEAFHLDWSL